MDVQLLYQPQITRTRSRRLTKRDVRKNWDTTEATTSPRDDRASRHHHNKVCAIPGLAAQTVVRYND